MTTLPLVTVIGVGVGVVDVDDVVLIESLERELLDWVVGLLDEAVKLVGVEDEADVVAGEDVVDAELEDEDRVEEVLVVVGVVNVVAAVMIELPLLVVVGVGIGIDRDIAGSLNVNERTLKRAGKPQIRDKMISVGCD